MSRYVRPTISNESVILLTKLIDEVGVSEEFKSKLPFKFNDVESLTEAQATIMIRRLWVVKQQIIENSDSPLIIAMKQSLRNLQKGLAQYRNE